MKITMSKPKKQMRGAPKRLFVVGMLAMLALSSLFVQSASFAQSDVEVDPPSRVARLSYVSGAASFAPAGSDDWADMNVNRPLTVGDSLWVPPNGRAEMHIGSSAFRLGESSSLSFLTLSDDKIQLKITRGTLVVRVRDLSTRDVIEINTPNLAFSLQEPGEYRINVNDDNTTNVIIRRGTGIAYGDRDSLTVRESEQVLFSGTNLVHRSINRIPPYDAFDLWVNDRDRAEDTSVSAQYVSREVIGYQQLDQNGSWENSTEYGAVWYPRTVQSGWAPYRDGNWVWVAPWGWTWVDRAPWGFAPYHYGRWAYVGRRWGWVPGQHLRHSTPVYAPALVAFVGGGSGVSLSLSIGGRSRGPGVAWFPLAPGEAYRPSYYGSSRYVSRINSNVGNTHIVNNTVINNTRNVYINQNIRNAVTAVPTATFVKGQATAGAAVPIDTKQFNNAQVGHGGPGIAPTNESMFGGARRAVVPNGEQYRARPVVATFNPAQVPVTPIGRGSRDDYRRGSSASGNPTTAPTIGNTPSSGVAGAAAIAPVTVNNPNANVVMHGGRRGDDAGRPTGGFDRGDRRNNGNDGNNANTVNRIERGDRNLNNNPTRIEPYPDTPDPRDISKNTSNNGRSTPAVIGNQPNARLNNNGADQNDAQRRDRRDVLNERGIDGQLRQPNGAPRPTPPAPPPPVYAAPAPTIQAAPTPAPSPAPAAPIAAPVPRPNAGYPEPNEAQRRHQPGNRAGEREPEQNPRQFEAQRPQVPQPPRDVPRPPPPLPAAVQQAPVQVAPPPAPPAPRVERPAPVQEQRREAPPEKAKPEKERREKPEKLDTR